MKKALSTGTVKTDQEHLTGIYFCPWRSRGAMQDGRWRQRQMTGGAILDLEGEGCFLPSRLHIHVANGRNRSDELSIRHGGEQTAPCSSLGQQDLGFQKRRLRTGRWKHRQPSDNLGELESRRGRGEENLRYKQVEPPTTDGGVGVALRK